MGVDMDGCKYTYNREYANFTRERERERQAIQSQSTTIDLHVRAIREGLLHKKFGSYKLK